MAQPRSTAVAETPVHECSRQLHLDSVWTQRSVTFQGRKGMVVEINTSRLVPGLPTQGESFTVVLFRPDRSLDPDTIRRVDGALLAEIKEDSWELFPSNSPFVDDPYVKHVCVPGTKVGWRWTEEVYEEHKGAAERDWKELEDLTKHYLKRFTPKAAVEVRQQVAAGTLAPNFAQRLFNRAQQATKDENQQQQDSEQDSEQDTQQQEERDQDEDIIQGGAVDLKKLGTEEKAYGLFVEEHYQQFIKQKEGRQQAAKQAAGKQAAGRQAAGRQLAGKQKQPSSSKKRKA